MDNFTVPADSGQTTSTDVPTVETIEKVAAQEEEIVGKNVFVPDENINNKVATIDEEIAALQSRIQELKDFRKQFLTSTMASSAEN